MRIMEIELYFEHQSKCSFLSKINVKVFEMVMDSNMDRINFYQSYKLLVNVEDRSEMNVGCEIYM